MSKQIKFVFEREDGQTLETNTIDIPDSQLIWSGRSTIVNDDSIYIDEAEDYPELFEEPGLFALTFEIRPPVPNVGFLITTVFIDTERLAGLGQTNFSGMRFGSLNYGDMSGVLVYGHITFENEDGYVSYKDGYFYDFGEIEVDQTLTPGNLGHIYLLSIHRITSEI